MPRKEYEGVLSEPKTMDLDPSKLVIDSGWNPRRDENLDLEDLMPSIRENGVLFPILVRGVGNRLHVVAGHRRVLCAKYLNETEGLSIKVPARLAKVRLSEWELLSYAFAENNGKNLKPEEEAMLFRRMEGYGKTQAEIARLLGIPAVHVNQRLMLLNATPEVQKDLREGNITVSDAAKIIRGARSDIKMQTKKLHDLKSYKKINRKKKGARSGTPDQYLEVTEDQQEEFMKVANKLGVPITLELVRRYIQSVEGYDLVLRDLSHAIQLARMSEGVA